MQTISNNTTAPLPPAVKAEMKEQTKIAFLSNREKNAAARQEEKARKGLFANMEAHGISSLESTIVLPEGGRAILVAEVVAPEGQAVDVRALWALVREGAITEDQFLDSVTATQKAVTETVGAAILRRVTVPTKGTRNVKVSAKKKG